MRALRILGPVEGLAERIDPGELARLVGYPAGKALEGRPAELVEEARRWFGGHGRPWSAVRRIGILTVDESRVLLEGGAILRSLSLAERLLRTESDELVVAVSTAGAEVDAHSAALWEGDRPDEAFFVDRFGAAVAEYQATSTAAWMRDQLTRSERGLLPGHSPGYDGWPLDDQRVLFRLLGTEQAELPGPLAVMDSGMMSPKNSLLAAFGMTRRPDLAEPLWRRSRCSWCSLSPCALRHSGSSGNSA